MIAHLGRRYRFSASHRLHQMGLSEEANRTLYGKCNNPHGHGHNYTVEVMFCGEVDPETGMVLDLAALDAFAREEVLPQFEYANLNCHPAFQAQVPSTEHLAAELFRLFGGFPQARLECVHVEETRNNSFTYCGKEPTAAHG